MECILAPTAHYTFVMRFQKLEKNNLERLPKNTPIIKEINTEINPIKKDILAPTTNLLRTSLPNLSCYFT